jgi:hypothetical protein
MQTTSNVLLVRPAGFSFNEETAITNSFQNKISLEKKEIEKKVLNEFDVFVSKLQSKGIEVNVVEDTVFPPKPDAIFPNNWVSFHGDGTVILYPMCAPNRRTEKRIEIIDGLKKKYQVNEIIDFSFYENEHRFLEGTGSVCFDHENKIAYACLSPRTDEELFIKLCERLNYQPIHFKATDDNEKEIYHTNVMMSVAERFAVICLETIKDETEREMVKDSFVNTGHEIIDISLSQMFRFAGNCLALKNNKDEIFLALSQSAFDVLTQQQKSAISKYAELLPLGVKMIEDIAGGSARCMIAEIFLPKEG